VILGAVCARGGSKGVPRKALRMHGDRSLIAHAIECAKNCDAIEKVVVSTDDPEIAEEASRWGAEIPFLRPPELALDNSPKWEVFRHLVGWIEQEDGVEVSILVDLDVSVPLRVPGDIEGCLRLLATSEVGVAITAFRANRNPYFNMVEAAGKTLVRIVKPPAAPIHDRQRAPEVFSLSPAVFAMKRSALYEWGHWSLAPMAIHVIPRERAWDIDDEIDLEFVDFVRGRGVGRI
jgi:CMP-N,N'-diacetyllegionaminic acid synthase